MRAGDRAGPRPGPLRRPGHRPGRQAAGRVWLAGEPDPAAAVSWRTGTGRYRNVGARVRDGAEHVEPSLEDAYLLLRGGPPEPETAGEAVS